MERRCALKISKEEAEGITVEGSEICEGESFNCMLVGKIWMDNPYNVRAFKSIIIQTWRLKNPMEIHDLNKNPFLF